MFINELSFKVFYIINPKNDIIYGSQENNISPVIQMEFNLLVMVWGRMTIYGLMNLYFIPNNKWLNLDYYITNILDEVIKRVFQRNITYNRVNERKLFKDNNFGIFQQDSAKCHTSVKTIKYLDDNALLYFKLDK